MRSIVTIHAIPSLKVYVANGNTKVSYGRNIKIFANMSTLLNSLNHYIMLFKKQIYWTKYWLNTTCCNFLNLINISAYNNISFDISQNQFPNLFI